MYIYLYICIYIFIYVYIYKCIYIDGPGARPQRGGGPFGAAHSPSRRARSSHLTPPPAHTSRV